MLKIMLKRKSTVQTGQKNRKIGNFCFAQKECRKAENDYVNTKILNGPENNDTKAFWTYVKAKKRDNVGVAPIF